jgi:hypothetical protein
MEVVKNSKPNRFVALKQQPLCRDQAVGAERDRALA